MEFVETDGIYGFIEARLTYEQITSTPPLSSNCDLGKGYPFVNVWRKKLWKTYVGGGIRVIGILKHGESCS